MGLSDLDGNGGGSGILLLSRMTPVWCGTPGFSLYSLSVCVSRFNVNSRSSKLGVLVLISPFCRRGEALGCFALG